MAQNEENVGASFKGEEDWAGRAQGPAPQRRALGEGRVGNELGTPLWTQPLRRAAQEGYMPRG